MDADHSFPYSEIYVVDWEIAPQGYLCWMNVSKPYVTLSLLIR